MTPYQLGLIGGIIFGFWMGILFVGLLMVVRDSRQKFLKRKFI
jgi:tetrahydromethanopterin S-methyltransferase subunit B